MDDINIGLFVCLLVSGGVIRTNDGLELGKSKLENAMKMLVFNLVLRLFFFSKTMKQSRHDYLGDNKMKF